MDNAYVILVGVACALLGYWYGATHPFNAANNAPPAQTPSATP